MQVKRFFAADMRQAMKLINSLQQGQVTVDGQVKTLRLNNRLRGLIDTALASHQLLATDPKLRLSAAQQLQKNAKPAQLKFLDQQLATETDSDVHTALSLALANLQLVDPNPVDQAALQHEANGIAHLKPEVDVGVVHRRPAHLFGQDRLHDAQGGTVDKIQCGGEKHQCEHAPTGFASRQGAANLVTHSCVWSVGRGSACSRRRDHGCLPVSWNFYVVLHNK